MIDEIMKSMLLEGLNHTHFAATPQETFNMFYGSDSYKQALTAIYEIGLECIGAAEEVPEDIWAIPRPETVRARNALKASQRKAWAKACGADNE